MLVSLKLVEYSLSVSEMFSSSGSDDDDDDSSDDSVGTTVGVFGYPISIWLLFTPWFNWGPWGISILIWYKIF